MRASADRRASALPPLPANASLRWHVVRKHVAALAPRNILELGAGQGAVGTRLAGVADAYVGVEPDPTSRSVAVSRLPQSARLVDSTDELGSDETFDLACAFEVLEHIEDDVAALSAWVGHLRPGGHVLVSVPADPDRYSSADELAGHFRRYRPADLAALFEAAGLEVVDIRHYGFPLGIALEMGRNTIARRKLAAESTPADLAARTAGSGRLLQPPAWAGSAIWTATAPFRVVEDRFPDRGPGLVGLARRPG